MKRYFLPKLFISILLICFSYTQENILILPIHTEKSVQDIETINLLFLNAFHEHTDDLVNYGKEIDPCAHYECALDLFEFHEVDKVIFHSIKSLGEKLIYSAMTINESGGAKYSVQVIALSIEDFEVISRRVAKAIMNYTSLDDAADVNNIMELEEEESTHVRKSINRFGMTFGFLYPLGTSFPKDDCGFRDCGENENYSQMFKYSGFYSYELRNRKGLLNSSFHFFVPNALGVDFTYIRFLDQRDTSPFYGVGAGLFGVGGGYNPVKNQSGFGLSLQAGQVLFRTYDINFTLKASAYQIFNTDMDNGIALELGTSYKQPEIEFIQVEYSIIPAIGVVILFLLLLS